MRGDVAGLLESIRDRRSEFESAGERAQELRTLPPEAVQTLRDMSMFWLKTPAELGGTPEACTSPWPRRPPTRPKPAPK